MEGKADERTTWVARLGVGTRERSGLENYVNQHGRRCIKEKKKENERVSASDPER